MTALIEEGLRLVLAQSHLPAPPRTGEPPGLQRWEAACFRALT